MASSFRSSARSHSFTANRIRFLNTFVIIKIVIDMNSVWNVPNSTMVNAFVAKKLSKISNQIYLVPNQLGDTIVRNAISMYVRFV